MSPHYFLTPSGYGDNRSALCAGDKYATERQGVFNANSIGTGLSTDAAVVTQPDYNVAATTSDNKQGLVIKTGRDTGYFVENRYNALGQLIATNKGNGFWREYGVDAMGNQVHQIEKGREDNVDSNSWRHSYKAFDGMNRQTRSWMAHNGGYTVHQQTYNYNGKVVKDIQTDGSIIEHIYNGVGQKTAELHKTSSGVSLREEHWRYDALGNQTRHTDLMGRGVEKQYDAKGNLTHEFVANNDHNGAVLKEYRYDDFGRRISTIEHMSANASATTKTNTYEYDRADRLIKQISGRLNGQPYATTFLLDSRGSCHMFRHTMATLMLEHGADIRFIQAMLGHVKLDTTQIYAQVSIKKLKEVHNLTHPAKAKRTKTINWDDEPETTEGALFTALAAENNDE